MTDLKARARRIFAAFGTGDTSGLDEVVAEDFVDHTLPPGLPAGREGLEQRVKLWATAFSGVEGEILAEIEDGDVVVVRSILRGAHTGEFSGVPGSGRRFEVDGIDILRFENGRAVEHWGLLDQMSLLMQLGAMG
ncbi:MAG: ester cyclase [Actinomycetota bacterium]